MKKIAIIISMAFLLFISCENDDVNDTMPNKNQFLVDKVFDYNNNLLAEYFYNENNQLIKRKDTDPVNNKSSDYKLEYENNRVNRIIYTDHTFPQFNHFTKIYYNEQGQMVKAGTFKNGQLVGSKNYIYYPDGKMKGLIDDNNVEYLTLLYDGTKNVERVKLLGSGNNLPEDGGQTEDQYFDYEYDNALKPFFGINDMLPFEPLPYFGTEATLAKNISQNNMTENRESGTRWIYQYNEHNFPKTIEVQWDNIETVEPILWRITYRVTE
ncbi:hypothetical protein [Flavobacterium sp. HNIBRBA15423]|uniref:hypothetical protein n=1 Tax=Flavobacterium sp. HNIBRBA15423 TaxID=3458683 RepID=UPI004044DE81